MTKLIRGARIPAQPTRRGVLQGATALGAASLIGPFGASRALAQPKSGGALRIGIGHGNTTDTLDPASITHLYTQTLFASLHCQLTEIDTDGSLIPELAESWEASADGATWTFQIRQGVEFHNGRTLTAEDVIASINHHRGDASESAAKPLLEPITEMRADGANTVVITLAAPNADFPFILSDYHLPILPASGDGIDMSGVGAGGYVLESFEPGVRFSATRNPNYWKEGRAHFDSIEILAILDAAARQNALITDEVDLVDSVDLNTAALIQRAPNVTLLPVTGTQHYTFAMDTRAAPFNDNNVRLALKYGVKRQDLVDTILNGFGEVGNDHPIGRSNRFHHGELPQREFDPDRARFHLREAGLDSLEVSLSAADAAFPGAVDAAVLYSESAAEAGVTVNVVREPNDGYWSNVWMKKPYVAVYWGGRPTEDLMFSTAYASGASWNDSFWENARFNELLVAARAELDEDMRREMYHEMQQIVSDDGGVVIPMFASYVMAHSNALAHGEQVAANWNLDGFRCVERWWFA